MSTSDEKRREVAQELRDLAAEDLDDGEFYDCGEVEDALGLVTDDGSWYAADGVRRLARLIDVFAVREWRYNYRMPYTGAPVFIWYIDNEGREVKRPYGEEMECEG